MNPIVRSIPMSQDSNRFGRPDEFDLSSERMPIS